MFRKIPNPPPPRNQKYFQPYLSKVRLDSSILSLHLTSPILLKSFMLIPDPFTDNSEDIEKKLIYKTEFFAVLQNIYTTFLHFHSQTRK